MQALRIHGSVETLSRGLNGRLDALLAEREQRVRAEAAAEVERLRLAALVRGHEPARPEAIIHEIHHDPLKGE